MYSIDDCSVYYKSTKINNIPIYIFENHNMALPAWGTICSKIGVAANLLTFDTHADTDFPFKRFLIRNEQNYVSGLSNPYVREMLKKYRYSINNFSFEDVFTLSASYLYNSEHIKTAYMFGYLKTYTVIHKLSEHDLKIYKSEYEIEDRERGYDSAYYHYKHIEWEKLSLIGEPLIVDFDLDYFNSRNDLGVDFEQNICPILKRASGITIATEPEWFDKCNLDKTFSNDEALDMLIKIIDKSLNKK